MNRLRIIPLDETVVFPGMPVTLPVDVGSDERVLLVPRHDNTYAGVGVVAEVSERVRLAGRGLAVSLMALHRATPGAAAADQDGVLRVDYEARPDKTPPASLTRELEREYRAIVDEILELRGDDGRIRAFVRSIAEPGPLADTAGFSPDVNYSQKLQLLETLGSEVPLVHATATPTVELTPSPPSVAPAPGPQVAPNPSATRAPVRRSAPPPLSASVARP